MGDFDTVTHRSVEPQAIGEYLELLGKGIQEGQASIQSIEGGRKLQGLGEDLEIELSLSFIPREKLVLPEEVPYHTGLRDEHLISLDEE